MADAEDNSISDQERALFRDVAKIMFISHLRISGEEHDFKSEEVKAKWAEEKAHYGKMARMTLRRLEAKGYTLTGA